ncbi:unnamed protein product [Arctogadus glacialis]
MATGRCCGVLPRQQRGYGCPPWCASSGHPHPSSRSSRDWREIPEVKHPGALAEASYLNSYFGNRIQMGDGDLMPCAVTIHTTLGPKTPGPGALRHRDLSPSDR